MSSTTATVSRTAQEHTPIARALLFLALTFSLIFSANFAYATDKLEPVLKNRGKHYQTEAEVIPVPEDGIHDPSNDAVDVFQAPYEAMVDFPRDSAGLINWIETIKQGKIAPRADINGVTEKETLDLDILFTDTGKMPYVRFPHSSHTLWLDCKNCHPAIFKKKKGANNISMTDVYTGKFCGLCHGKVAFPPTLNCTRCHSVPQSSVTK